MFKKVCVTCHSSEPGVNKTGPSLFGVYGRKAGSSDFPRYKGLAGADFTWDAAKLDTYLQDPKAFVIANTQNKTTAMTYALKDAQQRADVIAYLQTLKVGVISRRRGLRSPGRGAAAPGALRRWPFPIAAGATPVHPNFRTSSAKCRSGGVRRAGWDGRVDGRSLGGVGNIAAADWDACAGPHDPFVGHAFFTAWSGRARRTRRRGWRPVHLLARSPGGRIEGCLPLYLKSHSYGEYVFDWAWAEAFERAGGRYYPKLQAAVPFTPVTGRRLLLRDDATRRHLRAR